MVKLEQCCAFCRSIQWRFIIWKTIRVLLGSNSNWSISEIFEHLCSLNPNKGPGPDGVPSALLKNCPFVMSRTLFIIFNESLRVGTFPECWKSSFVTPIFKSGDRTLIDNYRPISILSAIPKDFENLVTKQITRILEPSMIDQQYGFRPGA